jgi:hypothetical protein
MVGAPVEEEIFIPYEGGVQPLTIIRRESSLSGSGSIDSILPEEDFDGLPKELSNSPVLGGSGAYDPFLHDTYYPCEEGVLGLGDTVFGMQSPVLGGQGALVKQNYLRNPSTEKVVQNPSYFGVEQFDPILHDHYVPGEGSGRGV